MSCYITQDDRLQSLLTVNENMHIAADLKLGKNVSGYEKARRVNENQPYMITRINNNRGSLLYYR